MSTGDKLVSDVENDYSVNACAEVHFKQKHLIITLICRFTGIKQNIFRIKDVPT